MAFIILSFGGEASVDEVVKVMQRIHRQQDEQRVRSGICCKLYDEFIIVLVASKTSASSCMSIKFVWYKGS